MKNKYKSIILFYFITFIMKRTIIYDKNLIILDIEPSESDEIIYDRVEFIIKNKNKIKDYNKLQLLSKLFVNKKYKHLEYPEEFNDII